MKKIVLICFICLSGLFKANAQDEFIEGSYCTTDGQIKDALIFKNPKDCKPNSYENFIKYRSVTNSDTGWLSSEDLKWFTVIKENSAQRDSFVVSRSSLFKDKGFVQVILNGNHYKIYRIAPYNRIRHHVLPVGTSSYVGGQFTTMPSKKEEVIWYTADSRDTYLFGTEPNNLTEISRSIFADIMPLIMADKPEIVKAISNKEFKYGQIDALISYYQTGIKPKK